MSSPPAPARPPVPKRHITVPVPVHDQLTAAGARLTSETGRTMRHEDVIELALRRAGLWEDKP